MRFSVLGYQKQLVSRGALPRATAAKVSEADRSTMNGNGEPAGQWKPCAACTQPLFVDPRGGHCCAQCKAPVHSYVICEKVWMPIEGVYFCGKVCLEAYNGSGVRREGALPLRQRVDSPVEPPAQGGA